jgi:SAM-dependent methyltransferase
MHPHERWWEDNLPAREADFTRWLADSDPSSRLALGHLVDALGIRDVLDCGPGLYLDHAAVFAARPHVRYRAVDVTPRIVALGRARGLDVVEGSIEALPFPDRSVELVYCRGVLEHLPGCRPALDEMLRVSSRLVVATFWRLDPSAADDRILFDTVRDVPGVYHNVYARARVEAAIAELGVSRSRWMGSPGGYPMLVAERPAAGVP